MYIEGINQAEGGHLMLDLKNGVKGIGLFVKYNFQDNLV
jgi:hypothetical protein